MKGYLKTSTDEKIELNMDINNAWAIVAAEQGSEYAVNDHNIERLFLDRFLIVREASRKARAMVENGEVE